MGKEGLGQRKKGSGATDPGGGGEEGNSKEESNQKKKKFFFFFNLVTHKMWEGREASGLTSRSWFASLLCGAKNREGGRGKRSTKLGKLHIVTKKV